MSFIDVRSVLSAPSVALNRPANYLQPGELDPELDLPCPEYARLAITPIGGSFMPLSRRSFFSMSAFSALGISALATKAWGQAPPPRPFAISGADAFPQQDPGVVKEAVTTSHGNLARIRELVEKQPALA